jgi:tol-pal system protein YbgF
MLGRRRHLLFFAPVALLAAGCVSSTDIEGIQGQLNEIQRQVLFLQQQASSKSEVSQLESQIGEQTDAFQRSAADMQISLDRLSSQIDQLEANLADTNFRLNDLSQQIAATNQELRAARGRPTTGAALSDAPPTQAPPTDPQALYQSAYNDYLRGNYDLAVLGFRQYLDSYPDTELSDNAAYWIGESLFSKASYEQSIREFDHIVSRYPRSDKLASAMLKKGFAYLQMNESEQAIVQLRTVVRTYPGTDEANLARQRLRDLGVDAG